MPCPSTEENLKGLFLLLQQSSQSNAFSLGVPLLGHQSTGAGKHPASKLSGPVTQTSALALAPTLLFPSILHHSLPPPHTSLRAPSAPCLIWFMSQGMLLLCYLLITVNIY